MPRRAQLALLLALLVTVAAAAVLAAHRQVAGRHADSPRQARAGVVNQTGISVEFQAAKDNPTVIDAEWYQNPQDVRAHVHAAVPGKMIYYEAFATTPAEVHLVIDDNLARATLRATVRVQRCLDAKGNEITRDCPVGEVLGVEGSWFDTAKVESWRFGGEDKSNLVRGRLGKATVTLNGVPLGTSPYAEIVTNHLAPQTGT